MNRIIFTMVLVCMSLSLKAESIIQVMPFSTEAGMTSDDMKTFDIEMTNEEDVWGVQFDLYLPEGMTLDFTADYPPYDDIAAGGYDRYPYTSGRGSTKTYKHGVEWNELNDAGHYYRFIISPNDDSYITGTSGTILRMYYLTSAEMKPGVYPIVVRKTVISGKTNNVNPTDAISYVKVGTPSDELYDLGSEFYVPSFVLSEMAKEKNIVVNGTCQNLVLSDGMSLPVGETIKAARVTYDANVSSSLGFKTMVLPYDCMVPEGFEAYEVNDVVGNELQMRNVSNITANYPVLLKNTGTATLSATNVDVEFSDGELVGGELVGTYEEMDAPVGSYVLQNQGGNVAFYLVGEEVQPKVGAFRAYLAQQMAGVKKISVDFDDVTTGISCYEETQETPTIYNVAGLHVSKVQHGVNIIQTGKSVKKTYVK